MYLQKNQTPRGIITKTTAFKALTETRLIKSFPTRPPKNPPIKLTIHAEAEAYLLAVGWTQTKFVSTYSRLFETMSQDSNISTNYRLSQEHSTRVYATTPLGFTADSKNRHRDWDKVILPVVIEAGLVETYRKKLLLACPLARQLRNEIHDLFFKLTPPWKQFDKRPSAKTITLVTDKKWIFSDNIYVDDPSDAPDDATQDDPLPVDHNTLRTEFEAMLAKKPVPKKKKKTSKKDDPPTEASSPPAITPPLDDDTSPGHTGTPAPAQTTKDPPTHKKSDDIMSLISALKTIQKHRLLQCSDTEAPSGSTESLVSFAVAIIGRVYIPYLSPIPSLPHHPSSGRTSEQGTHRT